MEAPSLTAWMPVLSQIEEALARMLDQWDRSDAPVVLPGMEAGGARVRAMLQEIDQRFARMGTCLELAGRHAAEVETLLGSECRALEDWRAAVAAERERLESCANSRGHVNR